MGQNEQTRLEDAGKQKQLKQKLKQRNRIKVHKVEMVMLTREQNVFLAKKTFVELVYNAAYIEGCNVTFPQTQTIIDGAVVNGVTIDDIQTVLNLFDAWKYCIEKHVNNNFFGMGIKEHLQ